MNMLRESYNISLIVLFTISLSLVTAPLASAADVVIPDGTTVYLTTSETVVGKKSETAVGDIVRARVWRDVVVDGQIVIKGGTQAMVQVSTITSRKVFGIKGKMALAAVETSTVDGQTLYLDGGYNKEGKSRMGVALGVGIILFWPALFVPGKAAELPAGTVMDSFTVGSIAVDIPDSEKSKPTINLTSVMSGFSVVVLYDELMNVEKPEYFDFLITTDADAPSEFVIDVVNKEKVEPINLKILSVDTDDENEESAVRANVKIKALAKLFKKGINTFEVAYTQGGERVAEEVILQIEI
jgi:hypothetical protein